MQALIFILAALIAFMTPAHAQEAPRYVVLVTIDGYRWEDLFRGADPSLVEAPAFRARYVDVPDRAQALTPFLLSFREQGALIGDRDSRSCARVSNEYWFSYPGYAEMMEGHPNPAVRSNQDIPNPHVTILERLARRPEFAGQIKVFAEWRVMRSILNVDRSHLDVFTAPDLEAQHDPQVVQAARAVLADPPRVLWVSLGDTDNRAHEGDYDAYLSAATDADNFLREMWESYQANPRTAGRTTFVVTADHGRGGAAHDRWRGHGSGAWRGMRVPGLRHVGSDAIYIGARGPGVQTSGTYTMENCATLSQVAATLLSAVGASDLRQPGMAPPLDVLQAGN